MITTGHLCSGYDGFGLALALAEPSAVPLWHAETDPYASAILARQHPDVINVGDITAPIWGYAPHVDLLCSGDPCQSISIAGRQAGRDDARFLWSHVREVYRTVRPFRIFLENVANIVSHDKGRTLAERLDNLREDGYAVRWTVLGACAVGAPHHRHRWYLVAHHVGPGAPEAVRVGKTAHCGAPRTGGRILLPSPRSPSDERGGETNRLSRTGTGGTLTDAVCLLPSPAARDGDGRGEGSEEFWSERQARRDNGVPLGAAVTLLPTPRATDGPNGGPNQRNGRGEYDSLPGLVINALPQRWGKYAEAIALWEQVTGNPAPEPTESGPRGGRRLSPLLPEWMMGLEPGYLTKEAPRNQALKLAGNGVVPLAAAAAYRLLTT